MMSGVAAAGGEMRKAASPIPSGVGTFEAVLNGIRTGKKARVCAAGAEPCPVTSPAAGACNPGAIPFAGQDSVGAAPGKTQGGAGTASAARVERLAWCVHDRRAAIGCVMEVGGAKVNVVVAAAQGALSVTLVSDGRIPPATMLAAAGAVRRMYPGARVSCRRGGGR